MSENGKITVIDGNRYLEIKREARAGDKIKIVNAWKTEDRYENGAVFDVSDRLQNLGVYIPQGMYISDREYVVLEPVADSDIPDEYLDRLAAAGRKIAELTRRVDELERRVGELTEAKANPELSRDDVIERAKSDVLSLENTYRSLSLRSFWPRSCEKDGYTPLHYVDYVINRKKRTVVALVRYIADDSVDYRGIAKCAPGDVFNVHIGKAISLRRALGLEIPDEYVNAPAPDEPKAGDVVRVDYDDKSPYRLIDRKATGLRLWRFSVGTCVEREKFSIIDDSRTGTEREEYGL